MELKIEYDDTLPPGLTVVRTKTHDTFVDKISQLFENPYPSNIIMTQDASGFYPIACKDIYYLFTEHKAVYIQSNRGSLK